MRVDYPEEGSHEAFWYHKTGVTQSMAAKPDVHIVPESGKEEKAEKIWRERSRFFLAYKLRLPLAHVTSVILQQRTVSSIWIPCRAIDADDELALCAYFNSTIGILAYLGARDNRVPQYPNFSLDAMRAMPVPDFEHYGAAARDALRDSFEELKDETLGPLPDLNDDPVRRELDAVVTEALELDAEWVAGIRSSLSREPSITNRRYAMGAG